MATFNLPFGVYRSTRGDLDVKFRCIDNNARDSLITNDLIEEGHIIYNEAAGAHQYLKTYPMYGSNVGAVWDLFVTSQDAYTTNSFNQDFSNKTTDDLIEGTNNLYHTSSRVADIIDSTVNRVFVENLKISVGVDQIADLTLPIQNVGSSQDIADGFLLVRSNNINTVFNDSDFQVSYNQDQNATFISLTQSSLSLSDSFYFDINNSNNLSLSVTSFTDTYIIGQSNTIPLSFTPTEISNIIVNSIEHLLVTDYTLDGANITISDDRVEEGDLIVVKYYHFYDEIFNSDRLTYVNGIQSIIKNIYRRDGSLKDQLINEWIDANSGAGSFLVQRVFDSSRTSNSFTSGNSRAFADKTVWEGNTNNLAYAVVDAFITLKDGVYDHTTSFQSRPNVFNSTVIDVEAVSGYSNHVKDASITNYRVFSALRPYTFDNSQITNFIGLEIDATQGFNGSNIENFYGLKILDNVYADNKWAIYSPDNTVKSLHTGDLTLGNVTVEKNIPLMSLKNSIAATNQEVVGYYGIRNSSNNLLGWWGYGSTSNSDLSIINTLGKVLIKGQSSKGLEIDQSNSVITIDVGLNVVADSYQTRNGNSSHFVKGDGSLDNNIYIQGGQSITSTISSGITTDILTLEDNCLYLIHIRLSSDGSQFATVLSCNGYDGSGTWQGATSILTDNLGGLYSFDTVGKIFRVTQTTGSDKNLTINWIKTNS